MKTADYELGQVPAAERRGWLHITAIWVAIGIDLSGTFLGVELAGGMSFGDAIAATIIGSLLLGLLAMVTGYIGAATGLTSAMLSRSVFGRFGSGVLIAAVAVSSFGWFGVQAGFFAKNLQTALAELASFTAPQWIYILLGGALMLLTALWGYRAIDRLSVLAVPLLLALLLLAVVLALSTPGAGSFDQPAAQTYSFGGAVSLVMSIFVLGVVLSPDISRWAKTPGQAMLSGFLGFFLGNSIIVVVSIILSATMRLQDVMGIFFALKLGVVAVVVLTLAQWTTNTTNVYSGALALSAAFTRVSRQTLTLVAGGAALLAAVFGLADRFVDFISVMGILIAPYGGVYIAAFALRAHVRNAGAPAVPEVSGPDSDTPPAAPGQARRVDAVPLIAWLAGIVVAALTTSPDDGFGFGLFTLTTIAALDGVLVAAAVYAVLDGLRRLSGRSDPTPANPTPAPAPASMTDEQEA